MDGIDGIAADNLPTREDLESDAWRRLRAALQQRLSQLRVENDSIALDDIKTARLRGRIAEIKALLAMGTAPSPTHDASP